MSDVPISYLTPVSDVINQAVDGLGQSGKIIGDIGDGTVVSETARRNYGRILRLLLRAAHWPFARREAALTLLGDITGQSAAPVIQQVESPWTYAYAWPIDAVQGRWMPSGYPPGGSGQPNDLGFPAGAIQPQTVTLRPGRFVVSSSNLYPIETGEVPWDQAPDLSRTEGLGPTNRKIILTNNGPQSQFVYTRLVTVIEEWDDGFRQAMVEMMKFILAPVAIDDRKLAVEERDKAALSARNMLADARVMSANEAGYPQGISQQPYWITARNRGWWGNGAPGPGGFLYGGGWEGGTFCGWELFSLGGSVF